MFFSIINLHWRYFDLKVFRSSLRSLGIPRFELEDSLLAHFREKFMAGGHVPAPSSASWIQCIQHPLDHEFHAFNTHSFQAYTAPIKPSKLLGLCFPCFYPPLFLSRIWNKLWNSKLCNECAQSVWLLCLVCVGYACSLWASGYDHWPLLCLLGWQWPVLMDFCRNIKW